MRITRLQIRQLRRHRDLKIEFAPGLTVVRGPNEAGKTTIQRALELGLTRRVTSASADIDALTSWNASATATAAPFIRIDFEQDEDDIVKPGALEKTFRGAKGTVRLDYDGKITTDPAQADQLIAELTGIPTEAFFRSTASVRHHEVADLARDESALRDRLQASISGADRGTSRARQQLERALHELSTKGAKNPGRLKLAETAVASTQVEVDLGERALAQLEQDRVTLVEAVDQRAAVAAELATRRAMLDKARQAERLEAERVAASERFERFRTAATVLGEIGQRRNSHPSQMELPRLRPEVERWRTSDARIRELSAVLADEPDTTYAPPAPPLSWRWAILASGFVIVLGVALIAVGIILEGPLLPIGVGGAVAAIACLLAAQRLEKRAQAVRKSQELLEIDVSRRLEGRSMMRQELEDTELAVRALAGSLGIPNLVAAEDLLNREQEHVAQLERLEAQLLGLVGDARPDTIIPERNSSALEMERKAHALESLGPIAKEPRARERLEVEVRDGEAAQEASRDTEAAARARVEANAVDAEDVAGRVERLATWQEQLATLQRRARVYATTLAAIETAERATMRTATRFLERTMVGDIERITGGRYRRVRVDDATLGVEVFAPERGGWVDVSVLSQGTLDLIYVAARLGLVRLVTGDRRPPLVFDDPFVTLDDERATRAMDLLREISRDFQIIYLTTSARYDRSADAVRTLDGPTDVDDGAAS